MDEAIALDVRKRFVRITHRRPNGLVELEYAVGEPELFVELVMPADALEEFIAANAAEMLPECAEGEELHAEPDWDWRLADARRGLRD